MVQLTSICSFSTWSADLDDDSAPCSNEHARGRRKADLFRAELSRISWPFLVPWQIAVDRTNCCSILRNVFQMSMEKMLEFLWCCIPVSSTHQKTTRFLYTCISASMYQGLSLSGEGFEASLRWKCNVLITIWWLSINMVSLCCVHAHFKIQNIPSVSSPERCLSCQAGGHHFRLITVGVKGDWAYVPKVFWIDLKWLIMIDMFFYVFVRALTLGWKTYIHGLHFV